METEDKQPVTEEAETPEVTQDAAAPEETVKTESDGTAVAQTPYKGFAAKLDKFFGISGKGSTFRREIVGGLVTFMAMVYILIVNSNMFSNDVGGALGVSFGAIYIATAISAVVGTLLMALLARLPMAQASGMGLNAFFVFTICLTLGLSYANALILVLIDGIVFILLTVTGLRRVIFNAIPKVVRIAVPAGIGLFIAFVGLQNVGLVVKDGSTGVALASFNLLPESLGGSATYGSVMPLIVTILGLIAVAVMAKKGVKGAVLWAILGGATLYWIFMGIGYAYGDAKCMGVIDGFTFSNPIDAFKAFGTESVGKVFTEGFDFSAYLSTHNGGSLALVIITSSLAFCMVDMFDTMGTLYGACARGNMLEADGGIPNINKAMLCDAIATTVGAVCGTSTVTTFVESSSGIGAGARTGFASLITAACFFVAMFLSPIAEMIPSCATAIALIYVGVLMMNCVREIEWTDVGQAVPAFLTIAMMPFTYNISYGIAFGIISWLLIKAISMLLCVRNKDALMEEKKEPISVVTIVIAVLFILMFFLTH
ncbi:MAG: NCS2 family permease [Clostridiales bacterium]|nr:NCS2 family permease [Clostridiales bacterium]